MPSITLVDAIYLADFVSHLIHLNNQAMCSSLNLADQYDVAYSKLSV